MIAMMAAKPAVQLLAALRVTVQGVTEQVEHVEQAPPHPVNSEPGSAAALKFTDEPVKKAEQNPVWGG
jgi:hypothetical protein